MQSVYDEFDSQCRKNFLSEVFTTKSKEVYFYMRKIFQEKILTTNVKYHMAQTYKKLGVKDKAGAVMEAKNRNLI